MKFFATGQRTKELESVESARIFASGYVVDANGIDILDGWWALRLPNWVFEFDMWRRRYAMAQKILIHTRHKGFFISLDFQI